MIAIAAKHKWIIPIITKTIPLTSAPIYFTEGNKTLKDGYTGPITKVWQSSLTSVQQAELEATATLLQDVFTAFRYDLNQIPNDYTVEVRNRFKGLDLIECLIEVRDTVQETGIKTNPKKKKMQKAKMVV